MYPRALAAAIEQALGDTPVIFLTGARQTGKSTLVRTLDSKERGFKFHTFDDLSVLGAAKADPEGFVASLGPRAILDEVQRVPELFLPIKASVDRERHPGRFILTGSANVLTLPKVSESLAGRMEVLTLWPLAQAELDSVSTAFIDACFSGHPERLVLPKVSREDLVNRVVKGGYPEVLVRQNSAARTRWFDAYLTTLIQRDLRDLSAIEGVERLPHLLQIVASRASSPLNMADLGRTLSVNQITLKRHLTLFETLFLLVRLPPWFENLGKRLSKTPKIYLNDSGLLCHLLGLEVEGFSNHPSGLGPVFENFVVMELMKSAPWSKARPNLFHLRTSTGNEIEVILENRKRNLVGVEVKASATVSESDFKGIKVFQDILGDRLKCGLVLYTGSQVLPFGPKLWALPIHSLWGRNS